MTEARVIINKVTKLAQEEIESESEVVSDSLPPHGLYSLLGSSICGVLPVRVLEWVAIKRK